MRFQPLLLLLAWSWSCCNANDVCRELSAFRSCSKCTSADPSCAYCADTGFNGTYRCDSEEVILSTCSPQFIFQDRSTYVITKNEPLGSLHRGVTMQIQPQQMYANVKPGETVTFQLKYLHLNDSISSIQILNSEVASRGATLDYLVNCKGVISRGTICRDVQQSDLITFNITLSLQRCNNVPMSIGVPTANIALGVYVYKQCGCDCEANENHDYNSAYCSSAGTLVCGECQCNNPYKIGKECQCDVSDPSTTIDDLNQQCRQSPGQKLCSGRGQCACGYCACDNPQLFEGKYCECPTCPHDVHNNTCSGRGSCDCGLCACDDGFIGAVCNCTTASDRCESQDGRICSAKGTCECNECKCRSGYRGSQCEETDDEYGGGEIVTSPREPDEPVTEPTSTEEPITEKDPMETEPTEPEPDPVTTKIPDDTGDNMDGKEDDKDDGMENKDKDAELSTPPATPGDDPDPSSQASASRHPSFVALLIVPVLTILLR